MFQSVPRNVSFTIYKQIVSQAVLQVLAFKAEGRPLDRIVYEAYVVCRPGRISLHASPCSTFRAIVTAAVGLCWSVILYVRLDVILLSTLQS